MGKLEVRRRGYYTPFTYYDAEVEYVTFTGTQYVEIPIYPNDGTDAIELEFKLTSAATQTRFVRTSSTDRRFELYINGNSGLSYNCIRTDGTTSTWTALNNTYCKPGLVKHTWKVDYKNNKTWMDFDQFSITNNRSKAQSNGVLRIGFGDASPYFKGYLYSVKYWRNEELIYDLIPVRKNRIGYLFDKIENIRYRSSVGQLGYGIDKFTNLSKFTLLDYIENTTFTATSPYIDTGISSGAGTIDMSMTVKWNTIDSAKRQIMGANNGVFWGCDGGTYKSNSVDSGVVPSTTNFETINMTTYTGTPSRKGPLALFRIFEPTAKINTTTTYICSCKLAAYQIKVNNILVRDYVPVQHPQGTIGMFDKVENKFYFSANNGTFTGE